MSYRIKRFNEKLILPEEHPDKNTLFAIKVIDLNNKRGDKEGNQEGKDYFHPQIYQTDADAYRAAQELSQKYKGYDVEIVHLQKPNTTPVTKEEPEAESTTNQDEPSVETPKSTETESKKKISMDDYIRRKNAAQTKKIRYANPQKDFGVPIDDKMLSVFKNEKEKSEYLLQEIAKELGVNIDELKDPQEVEKMIKSKKSTRLTKLLAELEKLYPKPLLKGNKPLPTLDNYNWKRPNRILKLNEEIIASLLGISATICGLAFLYGRYVKKPTNQTGPDVEWFKIGNKSIPHPLKSAEQKKVTYKKPFVTDPNIQIGSRWGTKI